MLKKYSDIETKKIYNSSIKLRADGSFIIKEYKNTIMIKKKGFEPCSNSSENDLLITSSKQAISGAEPLPPDILPKIKKRSNISRSDNINNSKNLLIDYASENYKEWTSFITLTFKENVTDLDIANKKFHNYIISVRRFFPDLKYLGVPEFQKRGSCHYHLLTNIPLKSELLNYHSEPLVTKSVKGKFNRFNYYDLKYWKWGYSTAIDLINGVDDNFNAGLYLVKYLYKDIDKRLYGRKKIMKSNNLQKPITSKFMSNNVLYLMIKQDILQRAVNVKEYQLNKRPDKPFINPCHITTAHLKDTLDRT